MSVPQHSSSSENYITPKFIVDAYREVLGTDIALDPATSVYNNSLYIKATNIYTETDNGLESEWKAPNVFLNFPSSKRLNIEYRKKYGKVCSKVWFNKFVDEFLKENFETGLIVLFSNSHLNILDFKQFPSSKYVIQVCPLKQRVNYEVLENDRLVIKKQPTHHSSILYISSKVDVSIFPKVFGKYGEVWDNQKTYYFY